jgi:hypothetical protein
LLWSHIFEEMKEPKVSHFPKSKSSFAHSLFH